MTLTIGKFDGVHRGHQALLTSVLCSDKPSIIYSFSNHPGEVLNPGKTYTRIYTPEHQLKILTELGFDQVVGEPFTAKIANQSAQQFLTDLYQRFKFHTLILGYDAKLGKGRGGTPEVIQEIGKKLGFKVLYIAPFFWKNQIVSSSLVKEAIGKGDFVTASDWLGRPYSIYGCYTTHLDLTGLCQPPPGKYEVEVDQKTYPAIFTTNKLSVDGAEWINQYLEFIPTLS